MILVREELIVKKFVGINFSFLKVIVIDQIFISVCS